MNAPERSNCFRLAPGEQKCEFIKDLGHKNAATLKINKEDHTLGNLIRMQLLRDRQVKFAGYIHPHPLLHYIEIKVVTAELSPQTPMNALENCLSDLNQEIGSIMGKFELEVKRIQEQEEY